MAIPACRQAGRGYNFDIALQTHEVKVMLSEKEKIDACWMNIGFP